MTVKEQIMDYVRQFPGVTDTELENRFGKNHQHINRACRELRDSGLLLRRNDIWNGQRYVYGNYPASDSYTVRLSRDPEANVWIAVGADIPGLVLEDPVQETLMERVRYAIPELVELNHLPKRDAVCFLVEHRERLPV